MWRTAGMRSLLRPLLALLVILPSIAGVSDVPVGGTRLKISASSTNPAHRRIRLLVKDDVPICWPSDHNGNQADLESG